MALRISRLLTQLRKVGSSLTNISALASLMWHTEPLLLSAAVAMRIARSAMPWILLWIPKQIIDKLVAASQHSTSTRPLYALVATELALAVLFDGLTQGCILIDGMLGERLTCTIATRLIESAATIDLQDFEHPTFYDKLERVRGQATGRVYLLTASMNTFQELCTLASLATGIALFSHWLFVLLLISMIPAFVGELRYTKLSYSMLFGRAPARRHLEYLRLLGSWATSAKEIRVFGLSSLISERYRSLSADLYTENRKLCTRRALLGAELTLVATLGYYAAYVYAVATTVAGRQTLGSFTFVVGALLRARGCVERISVYLTSAAEQALLLGDLFEILRLQPNIKCPIRPTPLPSPVRTGIEFRDVSFAYPGSDRPTISNLSFTLAPGECVAIMGDNGAGKSTVIKLLCRLYEPTEGGIFLDGVDFRNYDPLKLRSMMGVLFQDFVRYDLTIRDNIGFGDPALADVDTQIRNASQLGGAESLIARYDCSYDQMLGKRYKDGVELSGGEWQKIALSRAFMSNAPLVILDEPTASFDVLAEAAFAKLFAEISRTKMSVIVTHRISITSLASHIILMECGRIVQQGTHAALIASDGKYAELYRAHFNLFGEQVPRK